MRSLKEGQQKFLQSLHTKGSINICNERPGGMDVMVEGSRVMQIEKLLLDRGIHFEAAMETIGQRNRSPNSKPSDRSPTTISNCNEGSNTVSLRMEGDQLMKSMTISIESDINNETVSTPPLQLARSPIPAPKALQMSPTRRNMDWNYFQPLTVIYKCLHNLEERYPSICTVTKIGQSVEGRDIKMLTISNCDAMNVGAWLDGGIHAREWISVSVVTYIADHFAKNYNNLPEYITNKDWHFVPVINPDGYHHTHTCDRMWRKNRARCGNTIYGVDLNRNFGYAWGKSVPDSRDDPSHINYRGPEAFSEPETKAVKDIILDANRPFKIFLTFHAFSELISFPWCHASDPCSDYVNLLEGATVMAKAIYGVNRRVYKVGNFKDLMYYATGTSIDWSYAVARIPFTYLVELRSKEHKFLLPKDEIIDCCKEILSGVKALAKFVDGKKCCFD